MTDLDGDRRASSVGYAASSKVVVYSGGMLTDRSSHECSLSPCGTSPQADLTVDVPPKLKHQLGSRPSIYATHVSESRPTNYLESLAWAAASE